MKHDVASRSRGAIRRRIRTLVRLWKLYVLRAEIRLAPTEAQRLLALTVSIGMSCGVAAVAFHLLIGFVERHLIDVAMSASGRSWIAWTIVTPFAGALVCGALLEYVVPNARGSGIPQVKVAFATRGARLRLRDSVGKFLVGALQIGSGSSLGREGPTVQICAGLASRLGRMTSISQTSLRRLLPVGAAAGIAAAFNAPIAAVTFTIEEIVGNLDQTVLSGVIAAAAFAAVIEHSVLGEHPVFDVPQTYGLRHASSLLIYALLGVAAAIVSLIFTDSLLGLRDRFRRGRIPKWARPGVGGLVTGMLAAGTLLLIHTRGITGGGYSTLGQALTGQLAGPEMLGLCVVKIAATVFSYASGGAGGIFAPVLFIGGTLGGAVGTLDLTLLGHVNEPVGAFALVGMGAVFAGVIRAPMTSVLIIVEMTGGYSLILPLMIANMTAYVLARRWRPKPIYEALLEQDGVHLESVGSDTLEKLRLGPLVKHGGSFHQMSPNMAAAEVVEMMRRSGNHDIYPVVDGLGKLAGIITTEELRMLDAEPTLVPLTNAADLMRPPASVLPTDDLRTALDKMVSIGAREIPVTDEAGHFVGYVDEAAIAGLYLRSHRGLRSESSVEEPDPQSPPA